MRARRRRGNRKGLQAWLLAPFTHDGPGHEPDRGLLILIGVLLLVGLFFLSSASSTLGFFRQEDSYFFVKQQITHGILPGILVFYIAARIEYLKYLKLTPLALAASIILLALVSITNLGNEFGTARSWIHLGSFSVQPSEFVKLLYIIYLAGWVSRHGKQIKTFSKGTIPFLVVLGILSFFIVRQPDIGTLSILVFTALAMFYAGGARISHMIAIILSGVVAFWVMIKAAPYRMNRFVAWLNPDIDPQGIGWQLKQSLIAIGSGGWFGLGLGSSRQKSYLPQPANDSIFAIIAEEIGFVFTLAFLALFVALIIKGFQIARHSQDPFAKMIAIGISSWFAIQVFVNIAGMIQLMPLTGVPLTFVSLGGSNMIASLAAMGILTNISRFTR